MISEHYVDIWAGETGAFIQMELETDGDRQATKTQKIQVQESQKQLTVAKNNQKPQPLDASGVGKYIKPANKVCYFY